MDRKRFSLQAVAQELAIINWQWRFQNIETEIVFAKQIGPASFLQARRCNYDDTDTGKIIERCRLSDSEFVAEIQASLQDPRADSFFLEIAPEEFVKITIT